MSEAQIAVDVVLGLVKTVPAIGQLIAGLSGSTPEQVRERLEAAREEIRDPIDTSADDAARRARLERILRGEG